MSTCCQAKRRRREARIDPRYTANRRDATIAADKLARKIAKEQERRQRASKNK